MTAEDAWKRISEVLRYSNHSLTKYFVLDILAQFIKSKWRHFSCHQRLGKILICLVCHKDQEKPASAIPKDQGP